MSSQQDLHAVLSKFWDDNVLEPDAEATASGGEAPIDHPLIALDSITAVGVLIEVEAVVRKTLPIETIVRKGGYTSKEQFVSDITAAVEKFAKSPP